MTERIVKEEHWIVHSSNELGPAIKVTVDAVYRILDDGGTCVDYQNLDYACWGNA